MKGFAIAKTGLEKISAQEIQEITGSECSINGNVVEFDAADYEAICSLVYIGQSITRAGILLGQFDFKEGNFFHELSHAIKKSGINDWLAEGVTFKAECIRQGKHDFQSGDVAKRVGKEILSFPGNKAVVDIISPGLKIFIYINENNAMIGIDFAGLELDNRDYKVFSHNESINAAIAYCMIRMSGWNGKTFFLDPLCGSGTIPIEAALWQTGRPHNYFRKEMLAFSKLELGFDLDSFFERHDKKFRQAEKQLVIATDKLFPPISAIQKNAKIAGVQKAIKASRIELEWLDIKLDEKSISTVVTHFPKKISGSTEQFCSEFMKQMDEIMVKRNASIVAVCSSANILAQHAEKHGFAAEDPVRAMQGKEEMTIIKLGR